MTRLWCWIASRRRGATRATSTSEDSRAREPSASTLAPFVDLADQRELTFALLDDTKAWRERAIHEIVLRDSDHVDVSTAYQLRLPVELIRRYEPTVRPGDRVRLLLPFTTRPKRLLLNVNFTGVKGEPCALLPRDQDSRLQTAYLAHLDSEALSGQPLLDNLWRGVSAYTVRGWRQHRNDSKPGAWRRLLPGFHDVWRHRALAAYLNADLKLGIEPAHIEQWLRRIEDARQRLVTALGEGEDPESSSENILLAIPYMSERPNTLQHIEDLIEQFCAVIPTLNGRSLRALAEYGRRWEAILETVVPVGQACSIKLSEQRPWIGVPPATRSATPPTLTRWERLVRLVRIATTWSDLDQMLALGEARTTHIEIRAADHDVVLRQPRVTDLLDERETVPVVEARKTRDAIAIYAASSDERRFARIRLRAHVRRGHQILVGWLLVLMLAAGLVALQLPSDDQLVESLALLTFPLTLAGAVVLWRETTSLAERLLRPWRVFLVVGISWMWAIALAWLLVRPGG